MLLSGYLREQAILTKISERVRFTRRRFGRYDVIDFLVVLFGYAVSVERTNERGARSSPQLIDTKLVLLIRGATGSS